MYQNTIQMLEPTHPKGKGDIFIACTLARAYLHTDKAEKAVDILKPLCLRDQYNANSNNILAIACAKIGDIETFEQISGRIKQNSLRDYLRAKTFYLLGKTDETKKILAPYIQSGDCENSVIALFIACIPDDDPLKDFLKASISEDLYTYIIQRAKEWQENATRAALNDDNPGTFSSSAMLFELGGHPVNVQSKNAAGITTHVAHKSDNLWHPERQ